MRLFVIFILYLAPELILHTFLDVYKHYSLGYFLEFLPLIIATFISGLIYKNPIFNERFFNTYLKLIGVSIAGQIVAKAFIFIQWYWFIHPEYRKVPGDFQEGLGFTILFFIIDAIVVLISYLVLFLLVKYLSNKKRV